MAKQTKFTGSDIQKLMNSAQADGEKDGIPKTRIDIPAEMRAEKGLDEPLTNTTEEDTLPPEPPRQMANIPTVTTDTLSDSSRPEAVKVILPSRGLHYTEKAEFGAIPVISNGEIWVRAWTFKEQKMFLKPEIIQTGALLDAVLHNCIATGGVDVTRLLSSDRTYLFWMARAFTYGDDYKYKWICENTICRKKNNKNTVPIGKLAVTWAEDDVKEPFPFSIYTGDKVILRFARGYDENASIAETLKKENDMHLKANPTAKKEKVDMDSVDEDMDRIKLMIVSLNGNPDRLFINREVEGMVAGAVSEVQQIIDKHDSGIEREVTHTCDSCGTVTQADVPLEAEFFRRSL